MSMSADVGDEVSRLRDKVADLAVSTASKMGEIETKLSGAKHDVIGLQQMITSISGRIDRFEVQIKADIGGVSDTVNREMTLIKHQLTKDTEKLSSEISTISGRQQHSLGFFAGIASVIGVAVAAVIFIFKAAFPGVGQ